VGLSASAELIVCNAYHELPFGITTVIKLINWNFILWGHYLWCALWFDCRPLILCVQWNRPKLEFVDVNSELNVDLAIKLSQWLLLAVKSILLLSSGFNSLSW